MGERKSNEEQYFSMFSKYIPTKSYELQRIDEKGNPGDCFSQVNSIVVTMETNRYHMPREEHALITAAVLPTQPKMHTLI